ncbi:hypothetical protein [Streptomyces niveus]|uniref:hypothetical protein n=1 Tax=Streptomyces niveus TaxID=193462 RepID=UPI00365CB6B6
MPTASTDAGPLPGIGRPTESTTRLDATSTIGTRYQPARHQQMTAALHQAARLRVSTQAGPRQHPHPLRAPSNSPVRSSTATEPPRSHTKPTRPSSDTASAPGSAAHDKPDHFPPGLNLHHRHHV